MDFNYIMRDEYFKILEKLPLGIFIYQDEKIVYANPVLKNHFEIKEETLDEPDHFFKTLTSDYQSISKKIQSVFQKETTVFYDHFFSLGKNGLKVYNEIYGMEILYKNRPAVLNYIFDLTTKTSLAEKINMIDEIFESTTEGIFITDKKGIILFINPAFSMISGYKPEEIIGKTPSILKSGKHPDSFYKEMWEKLLEKGEWQGEIWNKRKNGKIYLQSLTIRSIKNEKKETAFYLAILSDITHLRNYEKNIRQELKLAQQIQINLLPNSLPQMDEVSFEAIYKPMEEIGGDLYDFIRLRELNLIGIFISDISGHGIPAALIASMVKTLIETSGGKKLSPSQLFDFINQKLVLHASDNFLTAFYGIYDTLSHTLLYTRCAHPFPLIVRGKEIIPIQGKASPMLGIFDKVSFYENEIELKVGDKVLFYTDGLVEARNPEGVQFKQKLPEVLLKYAEKPLPEFKQSLYYELLLHCEMDEFSDDVCIVLMEVKY